MELGNADGTNGWLIEKRIQVIEAEGTKSVLVKGQAYMSWRVGDDTAERMAISQLYGLGVGTQEEIAKAFMVHVNSVAKYVSIFKLEGSDGLRSEPRGPKQSWKLVADVRGKILWIVMKEGVREYAAIQERLERQWNQKVSIESIRQVLLDNGLVEEKIKGEPQEQGDVFFGTGPGEVGLKLHSDRPNENSCHRRGENRNGREEALPGWDCRKNRSHYSLGERKYLDELERGVWSAYAGGLLFAPLIREHHFFDVIKSVVTLPTSEGYSLEQLSLTFFYFDVFEFRSIEDFKTVYPEEYGPLIGREVSPSLSTLRRFLHRIRELKKGEDLADEFGKEYLRSGLVRWGVLYIDSHFLPYYGMRVITKGWCGVRDKPLKGSYQFLAIDETFNPFVFLLRPSSEDLLKKIPELIEKARKIGREAGVDVSDLTVVFDREGYSAELFRTLTEMQPPVKFITWAKYMDRWVNEYKGSQFDKSVTVRYEIQDEKEIRYFETQREMNKFGKIRTVVIESDHREQRSALFTNDTGSEGGRVIQLLCRRWGHETLNKTQKWDHKMDYFPGYVEEELEDQPLVENPALRELKKEKSSLMGKLNELRVRFAKKALAEEKEEASWKEMKERNKDLCADMVSLEAQITLLELEIAKKSREVRFDEAHDGRQLMELNYEKKRFLDCIKIFTYMMEKKMCSILSPYWDDPKDIYVTLSMIVKRGGEIRLEGNRLKVRLKGFRDRAVDFAAKRLCEELNQMAPRTLDKYQLPIIYEVA
ncbi:MAG: hypothetical protein IPN19_02560 [Elusimicrobia bacterium]|nr:hypothetical protein [Elusimicrobiota bacterium]